MPASLAGRPSRARIACKIRAAQWCRYPARGPERAQCRARLPSSAMSLDFPPFELTAVHIPEAYGGSGADAIATAIVIEEVARACAASSLIPAVNKLGTVPLLLAGSEELKQRYLPPVARGEAMFSYALSEPESGSDAAAMKTRAVRDGD